MTKTTATDPATLEQQAAQLTQQAAAAREQERSRRRAVDMARDQAAADHIADLIEHRTAPAAMAPISERYDAVIAAIAQGDDPSPAWLAYQQARGAGIAAAAWIADRAEQHGLIAPMRAGSRWQPGPTLADCYQLAGEHIARQAADSALAQLQVDLDERLDQAERDLPANAGIDAHAWFGNTRPAPNNTDSRHLHGWAQHVLTDGADHVSTRVVAARTLIAARTLRAQADDPASYVHELEHDQAQQMIAEDQA